MLAWPTPRMPSRPLAGGRASAHHQPCAGALTAAALLACCAAGPVGAQTPAAIPQTPSTAAATAPAPTRLGGILDLALASDAQYAAARAAAAAGREKLPQAQAALRPNVNAVMGARRNTDYSTSYSGALRYDSQGAGITLTQPLFRIAESAAVEQAELHTQLVERQFALAQQDLLLRVARGYFDVLLAQDELAAAGAHREALVQQLAQSRRAFEVGTAPVTDLNEAQARHDLAVAQEIAARNELESRKRALEKSIARPLPALGRLGGAASVDLLPQPAQEALVEAAPRSAHAVAIAQLGAQIAAIEVRRQEAGHTPTLDLVASARADKGVNTSTMGVLNDTRQASVGFEFTMPVYKGGGVSARAREAAAEQQRAQDELTNAERQALLDARQAQLGVLSGSALTQALRQALASGETQLRSTQRGLQVGVRNRVDVLNAEQQLFVTRKDLAAARYRTLVSALQLKAAAGVLAEADLRGLDALLSD